MILPYTGPFEHFNVRRRQLELEIMSLAHEVIFEILRLKGNLKSGMSIKSRPLSRGVYRVYKGVYRVYKGAYNILSIRKI